MYIKTLKKYHFYLLYVALLASCATTRVPLTPPVSSVYTVRVQQQFDALPNGTHIDFQHGRRVQPGNLDRWHTYCRLYVYNRNQGADYLTSVSPGRFEISAVDIAYHSSDYPVQPRFGYLSWGVRELPAYYLYQVGMRLTSADQTDVRSLNCYRKWATPRAQKYPTLAEIREALGDQLKLEPPPLSNFQFLQPIPA